MKGPVEIAEPSEYGREAGTNGEPSGVDFSEFMWMADEELDEFDRKVSRSPPARRRRFSRRR